MAEIRYKPLPFSSNPTEWTFGCLIDGSNDMEAFAAAYNRRYAKAHPARLCIDGHAYRRRRRTR